MRSPEMEEMRLMDLHSIMDSLPTEAKAMRSNTRGSSMVSSRASSVTSTPRSTPISPYFGAPSGGDIGEKIRKQAHNDVEKKRRYNINDRIYELRTLLPKTSEYDCRDSKGSILQKTCEYVKDLQGNINKISPLEHRVKDLEDLVKEQFLGMQTLCTLLSERQIMVPGEIQTLQSDAMTRIMSGLSKSEPEIPRTSRSRSNESASHQFEMEGLSDEIQSQDIIAPSIDEPVSVEPPPHPFYDIFEGVSHPQGTGDAERSYLYEANNAGVLGTRYDEDEQVDTLTGNPSLAALGFPSSFTTGPPSNVILNSATGNSNNTNNNNNNNNTGSGEENPVLTSLDNSWGHEY